MSPKQDSATSSSFEDNVKTSTELASKFRFIYTKIHPCVNHVNWQYSSFLDIGNKFASAGDFDMAIKYFTDAIKFNPTEYK